ncbi:MAG: hypothetical protein WCT07_03105 [Candidatus Paceibacterota bacterium]
MEINQFVGFAILGSIIVIMLIVNYNLSKKSKAKKHDHKHIVHHSA